MNQLLGAGGAPMRVGVTRVLVVSAACLVWLTGCETSAKLSDLFGSKTSDSEMASAETPSSDPVATGSTDPAAIPQAGTSTPMIALVGKDPKDDLHFGKKHYRAGHYGDAEKHFRRAAEASPRDIEAWLGLAASYDRLRRFDLADRAYQQALRLAGPKSEILNNQGYSYILRGDFKRAQQKLLAAQARDPNNPYIQNNMALLEESQRTGKTPQ
jgi:Flp pilus assembly protein TadD